MKLRMTKSCFLSDRKRGIMVEKTAGVEVEMNHIDPHEAEEILFLLESGMAVVIDNEFVPLSSKYICLRGFTIQTPEGFPRYVSPKSEIVLTQELASKFLSNYSVKPVDPEAWTLKKLLGAQVKDTEPKKMYDSIEEKESWVTKGMRR